MTATQTTIRVFFSCTGVGIFNRGIESFFREAFNGLHGTPGLDIKLLKGAGPNATDEKRVWCLPRTGRAAKYIGKALRRNSYTIEQLSSIPAIAYHIKREKPDLIFTSEMNLIFQLPKVRKWTGVPFRIIYSNGAPLDPPMGPCVDYVQQVTPFYYEKAIAAGDPASKQSMVPYGISVPEGDPIVSGPEKARLRTNLALPADRKIVISVGWISAGHKRMDYTIREIAALPDPKPFLVLLGNIDDASPPVMKLAAELLGEGNYLIRSVPYREVSEYLRASDVFVLSSLVEGFGRVYLEAMIEGLPVVAHDHPIMRFVLASEGHFADLSAPDQLAKALQPLLQIESTAYDAARRRESVRSRFGWENLRDQYRAMFQAAMEK